MRLAHLFAALALTACASAQREPAAGPETVSVLMSSESDAEAQRQCGSPVRPETVSHESNVVIYRCLRGPT